MILAVTVELLLVVNLTMTGGGRNANTRFEKKAAFATALLYLLVSSVLKQTIVPHLLCNL